MISVIFSSTNSRNISVDNLNLTNLAKISTANAEQTLTCYGVYQLGGPFVINKCYDCTQVGNVAYYYTGSKSTCNI